MAKILFFCQLALGSATPAFASDLSSFSSSAIEGMKLDHSEMNSDMHASAEYRANLVSLYAKKAVEAC